jgi:ligand-binding sensor domain-containing protein
MEFNVVSLTTEGATVYAATTGGVYVSNDNGATWASAGLRHTLISILAVSNGTILAGTDTSMLRSTDNGASWTTVMTGKYIHTIVANGSTLFAGTSYVVTVIFFGMQNLTGTQGVFMSTDDGASWSSTGLTGPQVYSLAFMGNTLFAGTDYGQVFLSTDNGGTWTGTHTDLTIYPLHLAVYGTNLFAGTWQNGVFLSTNNGSSWKSVNTGLGDTLVSSLLVNGNNLFAGTSSGGVFLSTNDGASWTADNAGLTNSSVNALLADGTNLFAGTRGGGAFLSTNAGTNWMPITSGMTSSDVRSLALSDVNLYAGTYGTGVFRSTNHGTTWTHLDSGLTSTKVYALATFGPRVFAGTWDGLYHSNDNGDFWTPGIWSPASQIYSVAVSNGGRVYCGTLYGVYYSLNFADNWHPTNFPNTIANGLATSEENLYAGTNYNGIFLSTDIGTTWSAIDSGLTGSATYCFAMSGTNIFAGTSSGVILSTNRGATWKDVSDGLPNTEVRSLAVSATNLFAGTNGRSVFKRPLSEIISGVDIPIGSIPGRFQLDQNYPNPFNPSTTVRYALPTKAYVNLSVFNTLGQQVATLVNENQEVGYHDVRFDGSGLASGVYFYRLRAGEYVATKRLLLLR